MNTNKQAKNDLPEKRTQTRFLPSLVSQIMRAALLVDYHANEEEHIEIIKRRPLAE
jgi:hypothetical protein